MFNTYGMILFKNKNNNVLCDGDSYCCKFFSNLLIMLLCISGGLLAIDVSNDGFMIATAGEDCLVNIWQLS